MLSISHYINKRYIDIEHIRAQVINNLCSKIEKLAPNPLHCDVL